MSSTRKQSLFRIFSIVVVLTHADGHAYTSMPNGIRVPATDWLRLCVRWLRTVIAISDDYISNSASLTEFYCFRILR